MIKQEADGFLSNRPAMLALLLPIKVYHAPGSAWIYKASLRVSSFLQGLMKITNDLKFPSYILILRSKRLTLPRLGTSD